MLIINASSIHTAITKCHIEAYINNNTDTPSRPRTLCRNTTAEFGYVFVMEIGVIYMESSIVAVFRSRHVGLGSGCEF